MTYVARRVLDLPGEANVQARELFGQLQMSSTPERWHAWTLHEVDGVSIEEIARQEGRPFATTYDRLRRARADFDAALVRDAASERARAHRRK